MLPYTRDMIQQQQDMLDRFFSPDSIWDNAMESMLDVNGRRMSPQYQDRSTDQTFQVELDVPGVNAGDINIQVKDDVLAISGHREMTKDNYSYKSSFSKSLLLDPSIDSDKITAQITNGVLVVTAPKDPKRVDDKIKRIPVMAASEEPVDVSGTVDVPHLEESSEETINLDDKKEA
jgi:HSP20 family molecular chaperone IbpA